MWVYTYIWKTENSWKVTENENARHRVKYFTFDDVLLNYKSGKMIMRAYVGKYCSFELANEIKSRFLCVNISKIKVL